MEIKKGSTTTKEIVFNAVMKGLDKQFIHFTAPGDVAGMKVLLEGTNNLYLFLPEFGKVRRVAAHVQNQGFLGSTFTLSDLAEVKLSPLYDATVVGTEGTLTTLTLVPKKGVEAAAAKIELTIDSSKGGVTKLRYFDGSGNAVREQVREQWVKIADKLVPTKISMSDLKAGDTTVITLSNVKVNQGVADDIFSRRSLLR
jgi:outer membrane lipoprotein-sorting protein